MLSKFGIFHSTITCDFSVVETRPHTIQAGLKLMKSAKLTDQASAMGLIHLLINTKASVNHYTGIFKMVLGLDLRSL